MGWFSTRELFSEPQKSTQLICLKFADPTTKQFYNDVSPTASVTYVFIWLIRLISLCQKR